MLHSLQDEDKLLTKEVLEKHDQRIELEKMLYDKLANFEKVSKRQFESKTEENIQISLNSGFFFFAKAALACQKLPLSEIRDWLAKLEDNSETPPA